MTLISANVKTLFADRGFKVLEDSYRTVQKQLFVQCPNGHQTLINLYTFRKGGGCKLCESPNVRKLAKLVRKLEWQFRSTVKTGGVIVKKYLCPRGHFIEGTIDDLVKLTDCPDCGDLSDNVDLAWESMLRARVRKKYGKLKYHRMKKFPEQPDYIIFCNKPNFDKWAADPYSKAWRIDYVFPPSAFSDYNRDSVEHLAAINDVRNLCIVPSTSKTKRKYNHKRFREYLQEVDRIPEDQL